MRAFVFVGMVLLCINVSAKRVESFDCSLDGQEAKSMDLYAFVAKLHSLGLTVESCILAQIRKEKIKTYQQIREKINLPDDEWIKIRLRLKSRRYRSLADICRSLFGFTKDNIVFAENANPGTALLVKQVFQQFRVPFTINVTQEPRAKDTVASAGVRLEGDNQRRWTLNLNPLWWDSVALGTSDDDKLQRNNALIYLAHEATHFLKYHSLKSFFMVRSLKNNRVTENVIKECSVLLNTFHEYEAELLMLKHIEYAEHQFYNSLSRKASCTPTKSYLNGEVNCFYPSANFIKTLAYRAVALHEVERELQLKKKQTPVDIPEFLFWGGAC